MKTPLEVAREEARKARSNAERAQETAERVLRSVDPDAPIPSGTMAMAVAAVQTASLAATAASEAAAHALSIAEAEAGQTSAPSFKDACLAVTKSLQAAVEAAQAAVASAGVVSVLRTPDQSPEPPPASGQHAHSEKRCAFCGRPEGAERLVAGSRAYICEECVKLCARILGLL